MLLSNCVIIHKCILLAAIILNATHELKRTNHDRNTLIWTHLVLFPEPYGDACNLKPYWLSPVQFMTRNLTLNLLTTTIVAPPSNASKWQMGFNSAFKGLTEFIIFFVS
jgi:hypothetical protein